MGIGDWKGAVQLRKPARAPAITVVIAGIYDEAWLLEIEAIAVA